ncbi:MAG: hypothetical protein LBN02_04325 [Oscillospiraceae bacterium]|jgi:bifunctional UDP-N-acetylglucosamine pyrophosphorylase/glucosamine-1-phosphate N-acetyltransferase|nr:hypothetical protein [Oscillospiraceae bacterium]
MSLKLSYYFEHLDRFPLPELLAGVSSPHELLAQLKPFLREHFPDGYVDPSAKIGEFAVIKHPVWIGANVEIAPHAYVRPYTVLGDGASVGHGSEVKASILFPGAKVASLSFVGDSILGVSARIGSGVITGNRKFDQSAVSLKLNGEKIDLGSDYFGLILGDSSRLGANCTSQPGTHIGHHTWIFPQTAVRGFIESGKRVWVKSELAIGENEIVELKP